MQRQQPLQGSFQSGPRLFQKQAHGLGILEPDLDAQPPQQGRAAKVLAAVVGHHALVPPVAHSVRPFRRALPTDHRQLHDTVAGLAVGIALAFGHRPDTGVRAPVRQWVFGLARRRLQPAQRLSPVPLRPPDPNATDRSRHRPAAASTSRRPSAPTRTGNPPVHVCPQPIAAQADLVTLLQPSPTPPTHRFAGTVDVGPAAAVDQAKGAIRPAHFGMTGHYAGALGGQAPSVAAGAADRAALHAKGAGRFGSGGYR